MINLNFRKLIIATSIILAFTVQGWTNDEPEPAQNRISPDSEQPALRDTFYRIPTTEYETFEVGDQCVFVSRPRVRTDPRANNIVLYMENFCPEGKYIAFTVNIRTNTGRIVVYEYEALLPYRRQKELTMPVAHALQPDEEIHYWTVHAFHLSQEEYYRRLVMNRYGRDIFERAIDEKQLLRDIEEDQKRAEEEARRAAKEEQNNEK
jgi:hypothetical protein